MDLWLKVSASLFPRGKTEVSFVYDYLYGQVLEPSLSRSCTGIVRIQRYRAKSRGSFGKVSSVLQLILITIKRRSKVKFPRCSNSTHSDNQQTAEQISNFRFLFRLDRDCNTKTLLLLSRLTTKVKITTHTQRLISDRSLYPHLTTTQQPVW